MIDLIGNTPLYRSEFLSQQLGCTVSIKADYQNPGMSSKDRPALYMIRKAEKQGLLQKGDTVVEASSGNTAIGLAMICKELGYKCHFFLSRKCSQEKRQLLELYGAKTTICTSSGDKNDPNSTLGMASDYCKRTTATWFANQYFNEENGNAHFETTGPEIWAQTTGSITHFVAGVGTGGTISGVGNYLKSRQKSVQIVGVDPVGSIIYDYFHTGKVIPQSHAYLIEGIGRNFVPGSLDITCIDSILRVTDMQAIQSAYGFLENTGFLCGFSSAAILSSLSELRVKHDDHVVLFFADHGSRYLSKMYNQSWVEQMINQPTYEVQHA